jgi:hypothetical protein
LARFSPAANREGQLDSGIQELALVVAHFQEVGGVTNLPARRFESVQAIFDVMFDVYDDLVDHEAADRTDTTGDAAPARRFQRMVKRSNRR